VKLRLDRNSIRLRLDAREVKRLARGESLAHAIHFGAGEHERFTYEIRVGDEVAEVRAELADRAIIVHMPDAFARDWAAGEEVGVEAAQFADGDRMLGVLIEKDAGCGHPATGSAIAAAATDAD
jgi:hypothetical protein